MKVNTITLKEVIEGYCDVVAGRPEWKQETKNIIGFRMRRKTEFAKKGDLYPMTRTRTHFPNTGIQIYNQLDFSLEECLKKKNIFQPIYFRKTMVKKKSVINGWSMSMNAKGGFHFYDPYFPICGIVSLSFGFKRSMVSKPGDKVEPKKYLCPKCVRLYNKSYADPRLGQNIPLGSVVRLSKKPVLTKGMIFQQILGQKGTVILAPVKKNRDKTGDTVAVQFAPNQIWPIYKSDLTILTIPGK